MSTNTYNYDVTNSKEPDLCLDGTKNRNFFLDNNISVHCAPKNDSDARVLQHEKKYVISLEEPN